MIANPSLCIAEFICGVWFGVCIVMTVLMVLDMISGDDDDDDRWHK